ncbi:MAG: diacylglycerol kinase [Oxalobacteraceae bacterium]|nr:MAG: diacylglycerol kinase [Oxalobacteraceae bacterium]
MRRLTSIVAVNRDGIIGCRNSLPWRVKSDLAFFKSTTSENIVLMGRKTYDSLGRCLPNRYNIVLSKQFHLFDDQPKCFLREGIVEGLAEAENAPSHFRETFVIGGSTMYSQFHDFVDRYLITIVDKPVADGDAFFDLSPFHQPSEWAVNRVVSRTQGENDEAPYEIFELISRHADDRRARREEAVTSMRAKRMDRASGTRRPRSIKNDAPESPAFSWI